jgi:dolichyl-phosphate-mannose-protein mannosyltransferase
LLSLALILFGAAFTLASAYALGCLILRSLPAPRIIVFATGSAALSLLIFALLTAGLGGVRVFLPLGVCLIGVPLLRGTGFRLWSPSAASSSPSGTSFGPSGTGFSLWWFLLPILIAYSILYFVHALAPEIQPDAITYHLGLVAEYNRLGGFPDRMAFYEALPQGLEMLFTFAFAFGKHSAAKLIHLAFLAATFPLMIAVGRRLGWPTWTSASAAALYVISPVAGISGTSAYNDAALVFFSLAAFYLLWSWKEEGDVRYLLPAGILAGFCYSIKMTGLPVAAASIVFVALMAKRRVRAVLLVTAGAALMIAPWLIRNTVLCGNPVAPFFNRWFPNENFHIASETRLLRQLRSYQGLTTAEAPLELTVRGELLRGLTGPVFLLVPLGLLALRRRPGRVAAGMAVFMAAPWFLNVGTRFLLPALPWLAFLIAAALPRPLALACVVLHAVTSWPAVIAQYEDEGAWRLRGFPLRAALRIEPEQEYLRRNLWAYRLAEMIEKNTKPGARILDLVGAPGAYITHELVGVWQSALGDRLGDALALAAYQERGSLEQMDVAWPEQPVRALRFRSVDGPPDNWGIHEVRLSRDWETIRSSTRWELEALPNVWEAPLAFDGSIATRWALWEPPRPGMYLAVDFGRPQPLTHVTIVTTRLNGGTKVEIEAMRPDGAWVALGGRPLVTPYPPINLRPLAARAVRRKGVRYILARISNTGHGITGRALASHTQDWGVERVASVDEVTLYHIR